MIVREIIKMLIPTVKQEIFFVARLPEHFCRKLHRIAEQQTTYRITGILMLQPILTDGCLHHRLKTHLSFVVRLNHRVAKIVGWKYFCFGQKNAHSSGTVYFDCVDAKLFYLTGIIERGGCNFCRCISRSKDIRLTVTIDLNTAVQHCHHSLSKPVQAQSSCDLTSDVIGFIHSCQIK